MKGWVCRISFKGKINKMNVKNQNSNAPALAGEQSSRFLVEMSHFFYLPSMTDEG